jgi:hypothetical protein
MYIQELVHKAVLHCTCFASFRYLIQVVHNFFSLGGKVQIWRGVKLLKWQYLLHS